MRLIGIGDMNQGIPAGWSNPHRLSCRVGGAVKLPSRDSVALLVGRSVWVVPLSLAKNSTALRKFPNDAVRSIAVAT
jgi:hypothetical protein